jgi:predicted SnoaL-like aldol condensation-catalyzing enzyme
MNMRLWIAVALVVVGFGSGWLVKGWGMSCAFLSAQTEVNKRLVTDFYDRVFNRKDLSTVDTVLAEDYIQHNPTVASGRKGFVTGIGAWLKENPNLKVSTRRVIAEGNWVVLHNWTQLNAMDPKDRGLAIVDIFRVRDGKIQEHWDVIEPVPEKSANANGMF